MRQVYKLFLFLLLSSYILTVNAARLTDSSVLQNMEVELNKQPWQTYQTLNSQASQLDDMSLDYKLWWLLRKAQAENLLYFLERFEDTVGQGIEAIQPNTSAKIIIHFTIFRGIVLQRQGRYQESQAILKKAKTLAKENKFTYLSVWAKHELAYTRSLTEIYERSLIELQQAYVAAFSLKDVFLLAKINEVYGAIYGYMHDYAKSIAYYQKALVSYQQLKYPSHEAEALYGIAATYRYWKKYDLAVEYYQSYSKAIEFSPNNIDGKFYAAYGIAMSEAEQGNCQQALISLDKALALQGLIDFKAELYKRKAQCLIKANKLNEAKISLDKAKNIFENLAELMGTSWQIEVIKIDAELAQAKGQSGIAYQLLKEFNQQEIALLNKKSADRLSRIKSTMKVEQQNVDASLLQQREKVQKLQREHQRHQDTNQQYNIGFVIILVLLISFFGYWQQGYKQKLRLLSIKDPLTDMFNRRYVFKYLNKLINLKQSKKHTFSIMVINIDNFKEVNDIYGHACGDRIICDVAAISAKIMRKNDVIGRVGGDEFLCVLPNIDAVQSLHIAQRLVNKVNGQLFHCDHQHNKKISISIGIATRTKKTSSSELYAQADKALLQAKLSGKNRAIQYQHPIADSLQPDKDSAQQKPMFNDKS